MEDKEFQNRIFIEKNKVFKEDELNVEKFNSLDTKLQAAIIKEILSNIYTGKDIKVDDKNVLKCLKLTCDENDNSIHLPLGLLVKKDGNAITFYFQKKINAFFIVGLLGALMFTVIGAAYSGFNYYRTINLNKDIDGDGYPDINIDMSNDGIADINIDLDGDNWPDVNIDYMGNRQAVFNIVLGDQILNPVKTFDGSNYTTCDINCDTNGDGWPDINLDVNGDGNAEINIDSQHIGVVDFNLDLNKDGICDKHCDYDLNGVCDEYCVTSFTNIVVTENGATKITGVPNLSNVTATLEVIYTDRSEVVIEGIVPDDMEGGPVIPNKIFTIENTSPYYVIYGLKWVIHENTFLRTSNNFKFSVSSEDGGKTLPFTTAPWEDSIFLNEIVIPPGATHTYSVSFKLEGTGDEQNYDKDKTFRGTIQVTYEGDGIVTNNQR